MRTLYINEAGQKVALQSHSSWEVVCRADNAWNMAQWTDGKITVPFVVSRFVGRGAVAVVGDTYMAANRNLESATATMPENIAFWRWLLTRLTPQDDWTPPKETP